jgi:hypothetical protein
MTDIRKNEIFEAQNESTQSSNLLQLFDVPTISVPLPSKGLVYPTTHPLHGKSTVTITAMTAAQENILTNKSLVKRGTMITQLIQSSLVNKEINALDLIAGDRNAIMVAVRISGYTASYKAEVVCPACDEKSLFEFQLDKLPIKELTLEPLTVGKNLFEFVLPSSNIPVRFKFLTGRDEEEINATLNNKKKVGTEMSDAITTGLLHMITSINGVTDRSQIALALPRMRAFDSQALRHYVQNNEPGIELRGEFVCRMCDFAGEVEMPFGQDFFWPRAK